MSGDPIDGIELPELVDLPVYRDDYISQKRVDELCRLIWELKPVFIRELVFEEKLPFPNNRNSIFSRKMGRVIHFLRDEEKAGNIEPISMIGMVDLTYEITRRIRHVMGLEDIEPAGKPIAQGPKGPFPELIALPIYRNPRGEPQPTVTQEKADKFCAETYDVLIKNHPEVVFI